MTSKAETLVQAVVTALTSPAMSAVPAARVYRDMTDALATSLFPAVVVEIGDEREPEAVMIGYKDRFVSVDVVVLASGSNPYSAADAAVVETFDRIFADRTLGGAALDVVEGQTIREDLGEAEHVASVRKAYVFHYRTTENTLDS